MSYGDFELDKKIAKLFDPKCVGEVYKNPQEHITQATEIYEKNAECRVCGKKTLKVISFENCNAICKSCGAKQ